MPTALILVVSAHLSGTAISYYRGTPAISPVSPFDYPLTLAVLVEADGLSFNNCSCTELCHNRRSCPEAAAWGARPGQE